MLRVSPLKPNTYLSLIPEPALIQQLERYCNSGNFRVRGKTQEQGFRVNISTPQEYFFFVFSRGNVREFVRVIDCEVVNEQSCVPRLENVSLYYQRERVIATLTHRHDKLVFSDASGRIIVTLPWCYELRDTLLRA